MSLEETLRQEPDDRLGMTPEQWEWFQKHTRVYGDQDENGVDLSLLRENLKLSPTERVERMLRNGETLRELKRGRALLRPAADSRGAR